MMANKQLITRKYDFSFVFAVVIFVCRIIGVLPMIETQYWGLLALSIMLNHLHYLADSDHTILTITR